MKLDILKFAYRSAPVSADQAIQFMANRTKKAGVDIELKIFGNALVHASRNKALAGIRPDADYVLFVDDDMCPLPRAALDLMEHERPVVSALCTTRIPPVELAARLWHEPSQQFVPFDQLREDRLFSGQLAVGAAFLMVQRPVIDQLVEYYLSAQDWLDERRRELDRLRVRSEFRENEQARKAEIRRARYVKEQYVRVFDFPVGDDEIQLGEDICLSRRLIALKIPVAIDTQVSVGHIGEYSYGPWDVLHEYAERVA